MIRRIDKTNNDLKDIIKSCPKDVIYNVDGLFYHTTGDENIKIVPSSIIREGDVIIAILPAEELKILPDGILYRNAMYSVEDNNYPDGRYNLQIVDNMNIWLYN